MIQWLDSYKILMDNNWDMTKNCLDFCDFDLFSRSQQKKIDSLPGVGTGGGMGGREVGRRHLFCLKTVISFNFRFVKLCDLDIPRENG